MKFLKSLLIIGLGIVSHVSVAQLRMDIGAKAGMNYYGLNLSSAGKLASVNYNSGVGFQVGGYALIKISKFAIQPEIVYSRQGQYFTTSYNSNLATRLNYINIPVIVKYYLIGGLNVQAGPQLGILVGSKGDLLPLASDGNINGQPIFGQKLNDYVNPIDFSVAFGAGLDLPFGGSLTVRYNLGISDINKNSGSTATRTQTASISTATTNNQVLQVSLAYRLKKIGK